MSEEQKEHYRKLYKGQKKPPRSAEYRANIAAALKGKKRSPEACANIAAGRKAGRARRRKSPLQRMFFEL